MAAVVVAAVVIAGDVAFLVRSDCTVVGQGPVVVGVAVAAPGAVPIAQRYFPGVGRVAREDSAVQSSQDAVRLPAGQPLGVIGQQPAERRRPKAGEERLDGTERHVHDGHDQEERLPRGRNGRCGGHVSRPGFDRPRFGRHRGRTG